MALISLAARAAVGNDERLRGVAMIKGSCCCGAISFELSKPPAMMGCCHCSRCRKVGASTLVFVRSDTFRWIGGEEMVQRYPAVPPYKCNRCFCSCCGTALGEPGGGDSFPINANCLDDDHRFGCSSNACRSAKLDDNLALGICSRSSNWPTSGSWEMASSRFSAITGPRAAAFAPQSGPSVWRHIARTGSRQFTTFATS